MKPFWKRRLDETEDYVTRYCKFCDKFTRHRKRGFEGTSSYREECLEHE